MKNIIIFLWSFKRWFLFLIYKINIFIKLLKLIEIIVFIFIYLIGLIMFRIKRNHFLLILLILEFIVIRLFLGLFFYLNKFNYEFYFSIIFLTMRVCEGVLGLSILVSLTRTHGRDYYQSFNMLW